MGGIGLAISPINPDIIYAIIESTPDASGFYRSADRGASWQKMSNHVAQGQYYNVLFPDPKTLDKVYSVETVSQYTEDGGKTWKPVGNNKRHVDDHAMWIDPDDSKHFFIRWRRGDVRNIRRGLKIYFKSNLPVTQFLPCAG